MISLICARSNNTHTPKAIGVVAIQAALIVCGILAMLKVGALASAPEGLALYCFVGAGALLIGDIIAALCLKRIPKELELFKGANQWYIAYKEDIFPVYDAATKDNLCSHLTQLGDFLLFFEKDNDFTLNNIAMVELGQSSDLKNLALVGPISKIFSTETYYPQVMAAFKNGSARYCFGPDRMQTKASPLTKKSRPV